MTKKFKPIEKITYPAEVKRLMFGIESSDETNKFNEEFKWWGEFMNGWYWSNSEGHFVSISENDAYVDELEKMIQEWNKNEIYTDQIFTHLKNKTIELGVIKQWINNPTSISIDYKFPNQESALKFLEITKQELYHTKRT